MKNRVFIPPMDEVDYFPAPPAPPPPNPGKLNEEEIIINITKHLFIPLFGKRNTEILQEEIQMVTCVGHKNYG